MSYHQIVTIADGVTLELKAEDHLDTEALLVGVFVIAGEDRDAFTDELSELITRYRI